MWSRKQNRKRSRKKEKGKDELNKEPKSPKSEYQRVRELSIGGVTRAPDRWFGLKLLETLYVRLNAEGGLATASIVKYYLPGSKHLYLEALDSETGLDLGQSFVSEMIGSLNDNQTDADNSLLISLTTADVRLFPPVLPHSPTLLPFVSLLSALQAIPTFLRLSLIDFGGFPNDVEYVKSSKAWNGISLKEIESLHLQGATHPNALTLKGLYGRRHQLALLLNSIHWFPSLRYLNIVDAFAAGHLIDEFPSFGELGRSEPYTVVLLTVLIEETRVVSVRFGTLHFYRQHVGIKTWEKECELHTDDDDDEDEDEDED